MLKLMRRLSGNLVYHVFSMKTVDNLYIDFTKKESPEKVSFFIPNILVTSFITVSTMKTQDTFFQSTLNQTLMVFQTSNIYFDQTVIL